MYCTFFPSDLNHARFEDRYSAQRRESMDDFEAKLDKEFSKFFYDQFESSGRYCRITIRHYRNKEIFLTVPAYSYYTRSNLSILVQYIKEFHIIARIIQHEMEVSSHFHDTLHSIFHPNEKSSRMNNHIRINYTRKKLTKQTALSSRPSVIYSPYIKYSNPKKKKE